MIYSAADDNFLRVKLMFEIANALFQERIKIDSRIKPSKPKKGQIHIPGLATFEIRKNERAIVEAILTFTVITLESLVNQALAEKINNVNLACLAIEYPRQILDKTDSKYTNAPELLQKLIILADQTIVPKEIAESSRNLVAIRNQVVHDKPFYYGTDDEGEVTYLPYRIRGKDEKKPTLELTAMRDLFAKTDLIIEYINHMADVGADFRFCSLFQGLESAE